MVGSWKRTLKKHEAILKNPQNPDTLKHSLIWHLCMKNGEGIDQDIHRAMDLYKKSADSSYAPASFNLGVIYLNGNHQIKPDHDIAIDLFQKAADLGYEPATEALSQIEAEKSAAQDQSAST